MQRGSYSFSYITLIWIPLVLLLLFPDRTAAFTPSFTTNTSQCGEFTISWISTQSEPATPPFTLLLLPVNSADAERPDSSGGGSANLSLPLQVEIPENAWNTSFFTGTYTIPLLPLRRGEHFVVIMSDASGLATGGISTIQTIGPKYAPTDASCLGPKTSSTEVLFDIPDDQPEQCSNMVITTHQATAIRGFIPGGTSFVLNVPAISSGNMTTEWTVNVPLGNSFVLMYVGRFDGMLASSGLLTTKSVAPSSGYACLANAPHSTVMPDYVLPVPSPPVFNAPTLSTGIIAGIVCAGVVLLVGVIVGFCILRRRRHTRMSTRKTLHSNSYSNSSAGLFKPSSGSSYDSAIANSSKQNVDSLGEDGARRRRWWSSPLRGGLFGGSAEAFKRSSRGSEDDKDIGMVTRDRRRRVSLASHRASRHGRGSASDVGDEERQEGAGFAMVEPFLHGDSSPAVDEEMATFQYRSAKRREARLERDSPRGEVESLEDTGSVGGTQESERLTEVDSGRTKGILRLNIDHDGSETPANTTLESSDTKDFVDSPHQTTDQKVSESSQTLQPNGRRMAPEKHQSAPAGGFDASPVVSSPLSFQAIPEEGSSDALDIRHASNTTGVVSTRHTYIPTPPHHRSHVQPSTLSSGSSSGGGTTTRGIDRRRYQSAPTEYIRHTDAGPMMASDENDGSQGRRRVVELPPSYTDVTGNLS